MFSLSLLQRYDSESETRSTGRNLAAAKIQSLFRMNNLRMLYKSVWASVREQEQYLRDEQEKLLHSGDEVLRANRREEEEKEKLRKDQEAAMYRLEGDLCLIQTFSPRTKEAGMKNSYSFDINFYFSSAVRNPTFFIFYALSE